jgi:copper chaperone CopZ
VRVEIAGLPGVVRVEYQAEGEAFSVQFDPGKASLEAIFAAVYAAGKKMGQDYLPQLLT